MVVCLPDLSEALGHLSALHKAGMMADACHPNAGRKVGGLRVYVTLGYIKSSRTAWLYRSLSRRGAGVGEDLNMQAFLSENLIGCAEHVGQSPVCLLKI